MPKLLSFGVKALLRQLPKGTSPGVTSAIARAESAAERLSSLQAHSLVEWITQAVGKKIPAGSARRIGKTTYRPTVAGAVTRQTSKVKSYLTGLDRELGRRLSVGPKTQALFGKRRTFRIPRGRHPGTVAGKPGGVRPTFEVKEYRLTTGLEKPIKHVVMPAAAFYALEHIASAKDGSESMDKYAQAQLYKQAAMDIRALIIQKEYLVDQLAKATMEKQAVALAQRMVEKGVLSEEERLGAIEKLSSRSDHKVVSEALDMIGPDGSIGILEKRAENGEVDHEDENPLIEWCRDKALQSGY